MNKYAKFQLRSLKTVAATSPTDIMQTDRRVNQEKPGETKIRGMQYRFVKQCSLVIRIGFKGYRLVNGTGY